MEERIVKLGKLEVNLDELQEFIVEAGKKGYAGNIEPKRMPDGSKVYTFQKEDFHYTDNYAGSNQAPGTELVRWQREDGQRIWQMSYSGGMLERFWANSELRSKTFKFLKEVLSLVSFEHPFRGPPSYNNENFVYEADIHGNIQRFSGSELIKSKEIKQVVFTQEIIGGLVVPK